MLGLTRKTDYALVALAALAEPTGVVPSAGGRVGAAQEDPSSGRSPVSARRIAQSYALPLPQLMNVFKSLQRAGLVRSTRGPRGGYELIDDPGRIDPIRVIEAIEGPVHITMCCQEEAEQEPCTSCGITSRCPVTGGSRRLNEMIVGFLGRVMLRDLMESNIHVPLEAVGTGRDAEPSGRRAPTEHSHHE